MPSDAGSARTLLLNKTIYKENKVGRNKVKRNKVGRNKVKRNKVGRNNVGRNKGGRNKGGQRCSIIEGFTTQPDTEY